MMLEEESDEEMRELAKEELNESQEPSRRTGTGTEDPACFQRTRTMKRTLSWRSVPVPVEMRLHFLQQKSTVCMYIMQKARRWKVGDDSNVKRSVSADMKECNIHDRW